MKSIILNVTSEFSKHHKFAKNYIYSVIKLFDCLHLVSV